MHPALYYDTKRTHKVRQLWTILVAHADRGDTLRCAAVYEMLDCRPPLAALYLNVIELYCSAKSLPSLVLLVDSAPLLRRHGVNVNLDEYSGPEELLEQVFAFPWFSVRPPSRGDVLYFKDEVRQLKKRPPHWDDDDSPEPSSERRPTAFALREGTPDVLVDLEEALAGLLPPKPKKPPRQPATDKRKGLRLVPSPKKPKPSPPKKPGPKR